MTDVPYPRWVTTALLHDRDCGFCRWCAAVVLTLDRRRALRPVEIQSPEGGSLLAGMDEATRMGSWHLVGPDGVPRSAGAAVAPLLRLLPGGRIPAALVARAPRAAEAGYRVVARNRGRLGRLVRPRARRWAADVVARRATDPGG